MKLASLAVLVALLLAFPVVVRGGDSATVGHVKVVSDKVEDVSSLDAWLAATIKPGMSDAEKARAIWASAVKFRHHDLPDPREYLGTASTPRVYDPIKLFNVYGYCTGNSAQLAFVQLARAAGFKVRHQSLFRWGVPEVWYDGAWHMYDVGMINYFPKDDGSVASVEEISAAVKAWHAANPGYHDQPDKLKAYLKGPGMKSGPALLLNCPTLAKNGAYTFNYFGWYSTMLVYDVEKPPTEYEEPSTTGYEVNNRLRRGEKLRFNWSNKGLHIGMLDQPKKDPETLNVKVGTKQLAYTPALGDLANSRIGNGTRVYAPSMSDLLDAAISQENVRVDANTLQARDPSKPASVVIDMPSSYVYLTGTLTLVTEGSGKVDVQLSQNNGLDWKDVASVETPGEKSIDLQAAVFRRYAYRVRLRISGGVRVNAVRFENDFQLSQRALPALDAGDNAIAFSSDPQAIGTITVEHGPAKTADKQLTANDFHVITQNIRAEPLASDGVFEADAGECDVTYPVVTPGDLKQIRLSVYYRADAKADEWQCQVSYDDGKTFAPVASMTGPTNGKAASLVIGDVPAGTQRALVRFQGTRAQRLVLLRCRIDADFAYANGAYAPVRATYEWDEAGEAKRDVHVATTPADRYMIRCAAKPTMKSLTLELAPREGH